MNRIQLNQREYEILTRMNDGLTNREIGEQLHLSVETIRWYAKAIYTKLNVSGREEAAEKALELALIQPNQLVTTHREQIHGFPQMLTSFIGRENELQLLKRLIQNNRLVTITGTGGIGKTRLSIVLAHRLLEDFQYNMHFIALAPLKNQTEIIKALARSLDITEQINKPLLTTIKKVIASQQKLLILDNFEHVLDAALIITDLLSQCDNLKILVTSREGLRLHDEQLFKLETLSTEQNTITQRSDAVGLFVQRAQLADPTFELTTHNHNDIIMICKRLDGLPLAIELAAARCKHLSVRAIWQRLDDRLSLLSRGFRDVPDRHQTIENAIGWSYDLLSSDEQQLFQQLAIFTDGHTLKAAEAICTLASGNVTDLLLSLVDKNIVTLTEDNAGNLRFSMLETIHSYAQDRLNKHGDVHSLAEQHATYYLEWVTQLTHNIYGASFRKIVLQIRQDYSNISKAIAWGLSDGDKIIAANLVIQLQSYWRSQHIHHEAWYWYSQLFKIINSLPVRLQVKIYNTATLISLKVQEKQIAIDYAHKALNLAENAKDDAGILQASCAIVNLDDSLGDARHPIVKKILALSSEVDNGYLRAIVLLVAGIFYKNIGAYEQSENAFRDSYLQSYKDKQLMRNCITLNNWGHLKLLEGDLPTTALLYKTGLELGRTYHFRFVEIDAFSLFLEFIGSTQDVETFIYYLGAGHAHEQRTRLPLHYMNEQPLLDIIEVIQAKISISPSLQAIYDKGFATSFEQATQTALDWYCNYLAEHKDETDVDIRQLLSQTV